ncbi:hypothetical protein ACH36K_16105 [Clostridium sp. MB05]|uniref:hypothetical protein n=1 Tax=Clostridium sp. MB05 TaxID=3376682 RepID=UPI003982C626
MKLSNEKLVNSIEVLSKLINMDLNIKASYMIARNISIIEKEVYIYNTEREKLINKYGIKDEDGKLKLNENNTIQLNPESIEDWNRDIKELFDLEINVNTEEIDREDLFKCNCEISPRELILIDYMIK